MVTYKYMLAIARRSLKYTIPVVTIFSLNSVIAWCVVGVSLGCISVVSTAVRDAAGSRISPSQFLCGALLCRVSVLTVCRGAE